MLRVTKILKIFFEIGMCGILFFKTLPFVHAEGEFTSDYTTEYSISPTGNTVVTQKIVLTNRLTNLYPKEYTVTLDTQAISNIIAYDDVGQIHPVVIKDNGKTIIKTPFNTQIVGLGKQTFFTLRFDNSEIAQKNGSIWEVNIPGISDSKDIGRYDVALHVPENFGTMSYITPLPTNGLNWTKDQMIAGGISAAFGSEQFFKITATYLLDNQTGSTKVTEIALPPDTAYQKVSLLDINPKPLNVSIDGDGNWMARYELPAHSRIKVVAPMVISVSMKVRSEFAAEPINEEPYLKPTKNWNSQYPSVMAIAKKYTSPRAIYDYVTSTLLYDYDRVNHNPIRKGAVAAIADPKHSVCMEFTDTFIAVARAAGIPARQALGYAYTTNSKLRPLSLVTDILHAWPEYYDRQLALWIPVDPTWAVTTGGVDYFDKMDFNHIVFAFNGIRDDYPYPAGSYKSDTDTVKLVEVKFADSEDAKHETASVSAEILFPSTIFAGFPIQGAIRIQNIGGVSLDNIPLLVSSNPESVDIKRTIDHLVPYTTILNPITFRSGSIFATENGSIMAIVNGQSYEKKFQIMPVYGIVGVIFLFCLVIVVALWITLKIHQKKNQSIRKP